MQQPRSDETPDHGSAPIKGNEAGRNLLGQAADLRLAEIVHQKASDSNLGTDIDKDADRAKNQVGVAPNGVIHLFADFVLGVRDFR